MHEYSETVEYISGIPRFAPKTDLENTRIILRHLGDPHLNTKVIHVAGTNGKGSVSKMVALMLEKAGFKVGLFTSPHLIKMNERISINGNEISDADFVDLFDKVMNTVRNLLDHGVSENGYDFQHPAYFEFLFVMAALYFSEQKCDYVVYETGLGGRLDATNVTQPEVSVITSIGMDHMQYLGDTIEDIAGEKAGIIKPGIPVVYNTGSDVADSVIEKKAHELKSEAIKIMDCPDIVSDIFIDRQPLYQYDNAATAIRAFLIAEGIGAIDERERYNGNKTVREIVTEALECFDWPGRCQWLSDNVIIDGAHNEDAVIQLTKSVNHICKIRGFEKVSLFFAVSSDKDYESIIKILSEELPVEDVYVTEINSDRRQDISIIMKLFQKYLPSEKHFDVVGSTDLGRMWQLSKSEADEKTLLVAVGSLYLTGEILALEENKN